MLQQLQFQSKQPPAAAHSITINSRYLFPFSIFPSRLPTPPLGPRSTASQPATARASERASCPHRRSSPRSPTTRAFPDWPVLEFLISRHPLGDRHAKLEGPCRSRRECKGVFQYPPRRPRLVCVSPKSRHQSFLRRCLLRPATKDGNS